MHSKKILWLTVVLIFSLASAVGTRAEELPVLSPDESGETPAGEVAKPEGAGDQGGPAPKKEAPKSPGGATIMTAEQGDELGKKIDKLLEDQQKVIEKLDQLQKDLDFVKVSVRVR